MKQQGNPWWKEPWPWLLMSGPLLAMVACGVTIWLAATHPDRPVDGAVRQGLVVQKMSATSAHEAARPSSARQP